MTETARGLAEGFPGVGLDAWRAAAKAALGLAAADDSGLDAALARETLDGILRGPLFTAADLAGRIPDYAGPAAAAPGRPWDVRALIAHPDPDRAGERAREAVAGGAASLALRLAEPGDADGVIVRSAADLARALEGVDLASVPVSLDGPPEGAGLLVDLWAAQRLPPARRCGSLGLDPLGRLAAKGVAQPSLDDAARWAAWAEELAPRVAVFRADARIVHEAGGSEAWEIAFAAASATACVESMIAAGLSVDAAARNVAFALALDADVHLGIAKIRALRRVWRRIARTAGASDAAAVARVEAFSSRRMLARIDPYTNLLRLTAAGFAAAAGGADSLTLSAFTEPLGAPTDKARRLARNIGLVLAREAQLARVGDPARGSYLHESLTDALARCAWAGFQEIARAGGLAAFIADGRLARVVGEARAARAERLAGGRDPIVGVTRWTAAGLPPAEIEPVDLDAVRRRSAEIGRTAGPSGAGDSPDALPAAALLRPIRLAEPFEREPAP